jgi:transposase
MSEAELVSEVVVLRRRRSVEERRRIVEETLAAGSSVARVARRYGINANQLFQWRRSYRDGHLGGQPQAGLKLLAVTITEDKAVARAADAAPASGSIQIDLAGASIRLEGKVDPVALRAVVEALRP